GSSHHKPTDRKQKGRAELSPHRRKPVRDARRIPTEIPALHTKIADTLWGSRQSDVSSNEVRRGLRLVAAELCTDSYAESVAALAAGRAKVSSSNLCRSASPTSVKSSLQVRRSPC